jgi:hypothetical protein
MTDHDPGIPECICIYRRTQHSQHPWRLFLIHPGCQKHGRRTARSREGFWTFASQPDRQ